MAKVINARGNVTATKPYEKDNSDDFTLAQALIPTLMLIQHLGTVEPKGRRNSAGTKTGTAGGQGGRGKKKSTEEMDVDTGNTGTKINEKQNPKPAPKKKINTNAGASTTNRPANILGEITNGFLGDAGVDTLQVKLEDVKGGFDARVRALGVTIREVLFGPDEEETPSVQPVDEPIEREEKVVIMPIDAASSASTLPEDPDKVSILPVDPAPSSPSEDSDNQDVKDVPEFDASQVILSKGNEQVEEALKGNFY
ncbi:hypothetical protein D9758_005590 [Tetrapyrgos nigripes]|uniref:Uncharacterized protein n=1 Tax=Tetrapyrgos nigripes TaxID=182062 RepID=A0A8H5GGQ2_9AGAR|nr:hypothetical protein D9758_005590 [Tetrapyrgos nigripes]